MNKEISITRNIYHKLTDNRNGLLYSRLVRAFFLFALLFLFPVIYAQNAYDPSGSLTENLGRADVGQLMMVGWYFLGAAFVVTISIQIFRVVLGTEGISSFFGTIARYTMLFALYSYGGSLVSWISESIIANTAASNNQIAATYAAFDESLAKLTMGPQEAATPEGEKGTLDAVKDVASSITKVFNPSFLWGFIFALILKFLLLLSLATKFLLLDITWPIVHQLVLLGFVFAVPFVAFSGWDPVKKFGITVIEVSVWPVIYNIGFAVAAKLVQSTFDHYTTLLAGAENYESMIGVMYASLTDLARLLGYFIFLITLGTLTPAIAAMVVRSESGAAIAGAISSTVSGVAAGGMSAVSGRGRGGMSVHNTTNNNTTINNGDTRPGGDGD